MWWCSGESVMLACQRFRVRLWVVTRYFPFSFSKKTILVKISQCRQHGVDRIRNGKLTRCLATNKSTFANPGQLLHFCASLTLSATFNNKLRHSLKT